MLRLIRLSRLLALIALLLIGLGGARAIPAVQGAPALVKVAPAHVLVTAGGKTLYVFAMDRNGMSACTGACAQVWPPLLVPSGRPALEAMPHVPGKFGLLKRAGSTDQLTYDGAPLYTYARDRKAGDMLGQGVAGLWWAVVAPGM